MLHPNGEGNYSLLKKPTVAVTNPMIAKMTLIISKTGISPIHDINSPTSPIKIIEIPYNSSFIVVRLLFLAVHIFEANHKSCNHDGSAAYERHHQASAEK